jgi:hypothetical protein
MGKKRTAAVATDESPPPPLDISEIATPQRLEELNRGLDLAMFLHRLIDMGLRAGQPLEDFKRIVTLAETKIIRYKASFYPEVA